jgi:YVTN family beta-propeller protein
VWVANPETDTVTALDVAGDAKEKLAEVPVGKEPRNLAISPDGKRVFVANAGEDTLTVLDATASPYAKLGTVKVGIEPYGLAFTPNGSKLYVANARSNTVSVVDPAALKVLRTITGVGQEPRGVAVTNSGDDNDADEKVYVTQFFGVDRAGALIGADDYKEGRVAVIATATDTVVKQAVLNPMADTGFKSNGSALKKIAPKDRRQRPAGVRGDHGRLPQHAAGRWPSRARTRTCRTPAPRRMARCASTSTCSRACRCSTRRPTPKAWRAARRRRST